MKICKKKTLIFLLITIFVFYFFPFAAEKEEANADIIPVTVIITLCGDGIIDTGEFCDDGAFNGVYSTSSAGRYCNSDCSDWGPYCGDQIYQAEYSEECDDGNNESGDGCTAVCLLEEVPEVPPGGGGGGPYPGGQPSPERPTDVVIKGKAYPGMDVYVLRDGELIGIAKANDKADFEFKASEQPAGVSTFGVWSEDINGVRSIFLTFTFQVIPNVVTTISGIYLPPSIATDKISVKQGETIEISGQTVPESQVYVYVSSDEETVRETESNELGMWLLDFNTRLLEENSFHLARSLFQIELDGNLIKSGFGKFVSFFVGEEVPEGFPCPGADLNQDGRVNLTDFSILLYWWGTDDVCADQNQDGIVNLPDFSIMMYYWTG